MEYWVMKAKRKILTSLPYLSFHYSIIPFFQYSMGREQTTQWEYLYFTDAGKEASALHPPAHRERLNQLGQEGWELTAIVSEQKEKVQKLYFKRPIGAGT
jgi:hypothetical protein